MQKGINMLNFNLANVALDYVEGSLELAASEKFGKVVEVLTAMDTRNLNKGDVKVLITTIDKIVEYDFSKIPLKEKLKALIGKDAKSIINYIGNSIGDLIIENLTLQKCYDTDEEMELVDSKSMEREANKVLKDLEHNIVRLVKSILGGENIASDVVRFIKDLLIIFRCILSGFDYQRDIYKNYHLLKDDVKEDNSYLKGLIKNYNKCKSLIKKQEVLYPIHSQGYDEEEEPIIRDWSYFKSKGYRVENSSRENCFDFFIGRKFVITILGEEKWGAFRVVLNKEVRDLLDSKVEA